MGALRDLTGKTFGRLSVVEKDSKIHPAGAYWVCRCSCGRVSVVSSGKLTSGGIVSCGCYRKELKTNLKHGRSRCSDRTYKTWKEMRNRCNNQNADNYKWYGGRGIRVCERWDDFLMFVEDMGYRPDGKTIDRIDGDGDYCKSNCKWSTPKEQAITNRGCFKKGENHQSCNRF